MGDVQPAKREDTHNCDLLPLGKLQAFQHGHWVYDDQEIGEDVDCGVGEPQGGPVEAAAWDIVVPEFGHRQAVQPCAEDGPGAVYG